MTLREKAEYFDEWEPYFEALARIRREVVKSIPEWPARKGDRLVNTLTVQDAEVSEEIKYLIRTMLMEIEDEK